MRGQPMRRLRSRSVEWLLGLLVLRHGRAVSRRRPGRHPLAGEQPRAGASQPAQQPAELRQALGPEAERLRAPTRDSLLLDLTGAAVDLLRFDAAIAAGEEGALQEAVALYRGAAAGGVQRGVDLRGAGGAPEACLQALERLADLALARGEAASGAGPPAPRAEALDPLRDSVQQRRMQALAASGDLPAALLSYREYRLRLHREMNLEPDPETTRLFRELQAGRRGAGAGGASATRPAPASAGARRQPPSRARHSLPDFARPLRPAPRVP